MPASEAPSLEAEAPVALAPAALSVVDSAVPVVEPAALELPVEEAVAPEEPASPVLEEPLPAAEDCSVLDSLDAATCSDRELLPCEEVALPEPAEAVDPVDPLPLVVELLDDELVEPVPVLVAEDPPALELGVDAETPDVGAAAYCPV